MVYTIDADEQDGSPRGFVLTVYEQAHLPRPEQSWGQVVYEQEGGSVLKKQDDVSKPVRPRCSSRCEADALASTRRHCRFPRCEIEGQKGPDKLQPARRIGGRAPGGHHLGDGAEEAQIEGDASGARCKCFYSRSGSNRGMNAD